MSECSQLRAYLDGELTSEAHDRFALHLAGCEPCQRELNDIMQLDALAQTHVAALPAALEPKPRAKIAFLRAASVFGGLAAAAIAAFLFLSPRTLENDFRALDGSELEARLSFEPADRPRTFNPAMSKQRTSKKPPSGRLIAELEARGELRGLAALYLLAGDPELAARYLESATDSADVWSDRAAVELALNRPKDALADTDRALAMTPQHAQASWNRGLALRELGLELSAARAFAQTASTSESAWSAEAKKRAADLSRSAEGKRRAWGEAKSAAEALSLDHARRFPGISRLLFYDALRSTADPVRIRELRPLAEDLDQSDGGRALAQWIDQIAASDLGARAPLAAKYRELAAGRVQLGEKEIDGLLTGATAAGASDIVLGTLFLTDRAEKNPTEYRRLADATGDSWFISLASLVEGLAARAAGNYSAAESAFREGLEKCTVEYRCTDLELNAAELYMELHMLPAAQEHIQRGLERARRSGEWWQETKLLEAAAQLALFRRDFSFARAALEEALLREPDDCSVKRFVRRISAMIDIFENRPEVAKRRMRASEACEGPMSIVGAWVLSDAYRQIGADAAERASLNAELEQMRRGGPSEGKLAFVDFIQGQLLLDAQDPNGEQLLRAAIARADTSAAGSADARKARAGAYVALIAQRLEARQWRGALELFAGAAEVTLPPRCALGVANVDERRLIAFRGANGEDRGLIDRVRLPYDKIIPEEIKAALAECAEIKVLARPPLEGRARVLPANFAWSYLESARATKRVADEKQRKLIIADIPGLPSSAFPRLRVPESVPGSDVVELRGARATPRRVLDAMKDATEIQVYTHGLKDEGVSDAEALVVAPDEHGARLLSAEDILRLDLQHAPRVILGACRGAAAASYLQETRSLPAAFIRAGASTVIASEALVPEAEAQIFFAKLSARLEQGVAPAIAVRDVRAELRQVGESWLDDIVVFEPSVEVR